MLYMSVIECKFCGDEIVYEFAVWGDRRGSEECRNNPGGHQPTDSRPERTERASQGLSVRLERASQADSY